MQELASRRTPINDNYSTCEMTYAQLRIYGDDLDPEIITKNLGLTPSSSQKKGEERENSLGRKLVFKLGGWFLSSEGFIQSKDVRRHLDWLLQKLNPAKGSLLEIQKTTGLTMDVNCIWWSAFAQGGPTLWPEQMRILAELNLECNFDISFYEDNKEVKSQKDFRK